jgi:hypothetical protein
LDEITPISPKKAEPKKPVKKQGSKDSRSKIKSTIEPELDPIEIQGSKDSRSKIKSTIEPELERSINKQNEEMQAMKIQIDSLIQRLIQIEIRQQPQSRSLNTETLNLLKSEIVGKFEIVRGHLRKDQRNRPNQVAAVDQFRETLNRLFTWLQNGGA